MFLHCQTPQVFYRYTESSVTDRKPLGFDDGVPIGSDKTEGSVVILMTSLMLSVEAGVHI